MTDHFIGKSYDIIRNDMIRELIDLYRLCVSVLAD